MESDVLHAYLHIVLIRIVITYGHFKEQYGVHLIMMILELNRSKASIRKTILGFIYKIDGSEVIEVID